MYEKKLGGMFSPFPDDDKKMHLSLFVNAGFSMSFQVLENRVTV
jgi:hypothetical protein